MTTCLRCQVDVSSDHSQCPLCHSIINEQTEPSVTSYPRYPETKNNKKLQVKIWLFITIIIITFSFAINAFTWDIKPVTWAPIVSMASFYIWFVGKDLYQKFNINLIGKTLWKNYFFLSLVLVIIDLSTDFGRWSLNYAIPFLGIATGLIMTIWSVRNKSMWRDDIGYILLIVSINIIPLLLFFAKGGNVLWPSIISLIYGGLTILGLFIFSGKRLLYELQKRFHF